MSDDRDGYPALEQVVERLSGRFPSLSVERIRQVVEEEQLRLTGGTIRDFLPPLVEHAAMEQLRGEADPVRVPVPEEASTPRVLDDPQELDPMERERIEREWHGGFLFGDLGGGPS